MSGPLPLRLCCIAAMAPALTEAATTPRVKLLASPPNTLCSVLVDGEEGTLSKNHGIPHSHVQKLNKLTKATLVSLSQKDFTHSSKFIRSTINQGRLITDKTVGTLKLVHPRTLNSLRDLCPSAEILLQGSDKNTEPKVTNSMSRALLNGSTTSSKSEAENSMTVSGELATSTKPCKPTNSMSQMIPILQDDSDKMSVDKSETTGKHQLDSVVKSCVAKERPIVGGGGDAGDVMSKKPCSPHEDKLKESCVEVSERHQLQAKRAERLKRRLRKLQARLVQCHISDQLTGLVEHQHKKLESMAKSIEVAPTNTDFKTELLQSEDIKNLSTASLVNLVRKLQSSQPITLKQRLTSAHAEASSVIRFDEDFCSEIKQTSGRMAVTINNLESALDSDATESSSGGESCDDADLEAGGRYKQTLLHRRAGWKWVRERSEVATRWTWLQAQVSDLEYRIRTQSDIHKQLRNSKGSVVLGEQPLDNIVKLQIPRTSSKKLSPIEAKIANLEKKNEMSPGNLSVLLNNMDRQSSKLTQSLGNCRSSLQSANVLNSKGRTTNGYIDATPLVVNNLDTQDGGSGSTHLSKDSVHETTLPVDNTCQAARCRPVRSYRKRKLYRVTGLHQVSRKASRLSTVNCQCYPPSMPCAMCGARYNNVVPLDSDNLSLTEKVALLDNSFHSVLSFPQDIPLLVHFEALLKSGEWQNRPLPRQMKTVLSLEKRRNKLSATEHVRKQSKKLAKTAATLLSQKYRTKFGDRSRSLKNSIKDNRHCRSEIKRWKAAKKLAIALKKKKKRSMSLPEQLLTKTPSSTAAPSPCDTPPPSTPGGQSCPVGSTTLKEMKELMKKRRMENAFDINNIIIPYSVAAATRVTKLEYKEIITPKWRELSDEEAGSESHVNLMRLIQPDADVSESVPLNTNGMIVKRKVNEEEEEVEDLSDEFFAARHQRCEIGEKKRYISYITHNKRNRGSRTESGAATPDPLGQVEPNENALSPICVGYTSSPPSTPVSVRVEEGRKRSGSISFGSKREVDRNSSGGEEHPLSGTPEVEDIPPWDPRTFPLKDEEYEQMQAEMDICIQRVPIPPIVTEAMVRSPLLLPSALEPVTPSHSNQASPLPSVSSGAGSLMDDDPNDPEWTVISPDNKPRNIVLKLAKR